MRVVTYNIHYAIGKDQRCDIERVVEAVRGADIIALQEVERNYGPGEQRQPEVIADFLLISIKQVNGEVCFMAVFVCFRRVSRLNGQQAE